MHVMLASMQQRTTEHKLTEVLASASESVDRIRWGCVSAISADNHTNLQQCQSPYHALNPQCIHFRYVLKHPHHHTSSCTRGTRSIQEQSTYTGKAHTASKQMCQVCRAGVTGR